jgi:hypothetical protein
MYLDLNPASILRFFFTDNTPRIAKQYVKQKNVTSEKNKINIFTYI